MISPYTRAFFLFCHLFIIVFWAVTSRGKNIESFIRTWTHIRSIPIVTFELLGLVQIIFLSELGLPALSFQDLDLEYFGIFLTLLGTLLAAWGKFVMGKSWGRPAQHDKSAQSRLVTHGPFRFSRNPIYVGLFLVFLGQQTALQSFGILWILLFSLAIHMAVETEEKLLIRHFGKAYRDYLKRTPRYL